MTAPPGLEACVWRLAELGDGVELLCRQIARLRLDAPPAAFHAAAAGDREVLGRDLERLASAFDLEAEPIALRYADADAIAGPGLVRLPEPVAGAEARFVIVWRTTRSTVTLLDRERRWRPVPRAYLATALRRVVDTEGAEEVDRLLSSVPIDRRRAAGIRRALLAGRSADRHVADAWQLRPEPGSPFGTRLRADGVVRDAVVLVALHAAQFGLWILAWAVIGRSALDGRTDWGWLAAWGLILATIVPLQAATAWIQGTVALRVGRLLKERLLVGALRLDPETVRTEGAGRLLGRVIESEAVEALAIAGGFQAGLAGIELILAAAVLGTGVAPVGHVVLLAAVVGLAGVVAWRYHLRRGEWTAWRLTMTHTLVERIAGHRTRLAQEIPERWHVDEDRALEEYVDRSAALDRLQPVLSVAVPRTWTAVALVVLAPAVAAGAPPVLLAVSVGGVLLASLALRRCADGLSQLSGALLAWRQAEPLFAAAARRASLSRMSEEAGPAGHIDGPPLLDVRNVSFRHQSRLEPVLRSCTLRVAAGDRILLQGPSGAGKSTFAAVVTGLRTPDSGLVLLGGLDRRSLGEHGWRRRVVSAPQFHENHVLAETFAFNLLMGRQWPPTDDDLRAAEDIVGELGLSDLVQHRMPAGLLQLVGEGGWQLSHGERSRLFMARALLQGGELMILDESFAALDPENLRSTLECVLRRAPALMVVAHP